MSEKARVLLTGLAMVAGLVLAGCGGESIAGPQAFDRGAERGEVSGLTVVPPADENGLELPDRGAARRQGPSRQGRTRAACLPPVTERPALPRATRRVASSHRPSRGSRSSRPRRDPW